MSVVTVYGKVNCIIWHGGVIMRQKWKNAPLQATTGKAEGNSDGWWIPLKITKHKVTTFGMSQVTGD